MSWEERARERGLSGLGGSWRMGFELSPVVKRGGDRAEPPLGGNQGFAIIVTERLFFF